MGKPECFDKYRDVSGGVMSPFVVCRERKGHRNYEMYTDGVQVNQGLTDEVFALSGGVKLIDPKSSSVRPGRK